jgi:hypothetical protein
MVSNRDRVREQYGYDRPGSERDEQDGDTQHGSQSASSGSQSLVFHYDSHYYRVRHAGQSVVDAGEDEK